MSMKDARINAGKTVAEVASMCGVSVQAVYQWESGETTPTAANLVRMVDLYKCEAGELLADARRRRRD